MKPAIQVPDEPGQAPGLSPDSGHLATEFLSPDRRSLNWELIRSTLDTGKASLGSLQKVLAGADADHRTTGKMPGQFLPAYFAGLGIQQVLRVNIHRRHFSSASGTNGSGRYCAGVHCNQSSLSQHEMTHESSAINSCMTCLQAPQGEWARSPGA